MAERIAVADLGSNSFRLVVFTAADGWWKRTDEIYEAVRIGEGLAATGELGEAGMARAQATMEVFAHFCSASGIEPGDVLAVATSAIRDATNSAAFLERAQAASGLRVRVLSGEEEARYGYLAAVNSTTLADGVMLDIGGGSMQLVHVVGRHSRELDSWRLGAVRDDRALPARRRPGQAQAGPRARGLRHGQARARAVAGPLRAAAGRHRRHDPQPRGGRPARPRGPRGRRPGLRDRARRARPPRRRAGSSARRPSAPSSPASSPRAATSSSAARSSCRR